MYYVTTQKLSRKQLGELQLFRLNLEYGREIPNDLAHKNIEQSFQLFDVAVFGKETLLIVLAVHNAPYLYETYTYSSNGQFRCHTDYMQPSKFRRVQAWADSFVHRINSFWYASIN